MRKQDLVIRWLRVEEPTLKG